MELDELEWSVWRPLKGRGLKGGVPAAPGVYMFGLCGDQQDVTPFYVGASINLYMEIHQRIALGKDWRSTAPVCRIQHLADIETQVFRFALCPYPLGAEARLIAETTGLVNVLGGGRSAVSNGHLRANDLIRRYAGESLRLNEVGRLDKEMSEENFRTYYGGDPRRRGFSVKPAKAAAWFEKRGSYLVAVVATPPAEAHLAQVKPPDWHKQEWRPVVAAR